jgi:hypothetical protein
VSGSDDGGQVGDEILAGTAAGEMRARRAGHGDKTLVFEDPFHFFTLHGRVLRDTLLRKFLRLDSEHNFATCLRMLRAA